MKSASARLRLILLCAALVGLVLYAFVGATDCGFAFDDGTYILDNTRLRTGLSLPTLGWACTTFYAGNWHPLTWLSHGLDLKLYGLNPTGHHLTSVLLHALNAVLLLLVLRAMTGSTWRSALVAALFAVHPLRVESVAWVSERKDLLGAFFWLLVMLAYFAYTRRPGAGRYVLVLALFAAGLMSKPMLVTLPLVLLLLDYWPLARSGRTPFRRLLIEKLPMLALSGAACVVTMLAQRGWGAVSEERYLPLGVRLANAVVSYVAYLRKMFWPTDLAVYYPHPGLGIPVWHTVAAAALLIGITCLTVWLRRRRPEVFVGWLWYLVTLLPVIGLVQVGNQGMADRYTYLPMIGLLMAAAWLLPEPAGLRVKAAIALPVIAVLGVLMVQTRQQTRYWQNDVTLFSRALQVTRDNWMAHYGLSRALGVAGYYDAAADQARKALAINPDSVCAHTSLAVALGRTGQLDEAIAELQRALEIDPKDVIARVDLAAALYTAGRTDEARRELDEAFRLDFEQATQIIDRYKLRDHLPPIR